MCARDEQVHNLNYPVVATWHYTYYMGIELNHKSIYYCCNSNSAWGGE